MPNINGVATRHKEGKNKLLVLGKMALVGILVYRDPHQNMSCKKVFIVVG